MTTSTTQLTSAPPRRCNLLLHYNDDAVDRSALADVATPKSTRTWCPVSHIDLVRCVERSLLSAGLRIIEEAHGLAKDGDRYFGLLQVANGRNHPDYSWVVGIRNSHDKTFPSGIVAGTQVLVCSNLCFSGEIKLTRKHTPMIWRDLPNLADAAVDKLLGKWHTQDRRIEVYQNSNLRDRTAHDLVIQALDADVIPSTKVPSLLQEWRTPRHPEFEPRNVWSLHNAFTEVLKGNLNQLPTRTERLQTLLDQYTGIALN